MMRGGVVGCLMKMSGHIVMVEQPVLCVPGGEGSLKSSTVVCDRLKKRPM